MGPMIHWLVHLMRYISTGDYIAMRNNGASVRKIAILALCLHVLHEDYDIHRHESLSEDKARVHVDRRNQTLQRYMLAATVFKAGTGQLDAYPTGEYRSLSTWPRLTPEEVRKFQDSRIFTAYLARRHANVFLRRGIAVQQWQIIGYDLQKRLKAVKDHIKSHGLFNYVPAVGGIQTSGTEFRHFRCMNIFFELTRTAKGAVLFELTEDQKRMIRLDRHRMYRTQREMNEAWQARPLQYL